MTTVALSKLVVKNLGDPKRVSTKPDGDMSPMLLGTLIGIAEKVRTKTAVNGDTFEALIGNFEGKRAQPMEMESTDPTTGEVRKVMVDTITSGVCYLPEALHEQVVSVLKSESNNGQPVSFGIAVSVRRANNPIGYEYLVEPLFRAERADPLAAIRSAITQREEPAKIEGPKEHKGREAA